MKLSKIILSEENRYNKDGYEEGDIKLMGDMILPTDKMVVLQAEEDTYNRGLLVTSNKDKSYDVAYWADDKTKPYPIGIEIDGKDNLWIIGYSKSIDFDFNSNKGKNDAVLIQLSKNRILKEILSIGAEGEDIANSLIHFNENEIIVAGYSDSKEDFFVENNGGKDIFLAFFK